MISKKKLIQIYNSINSKKISNNDILPILSKLYLILNKVDLDEIEIINLIDVLLYFYEQNELEKINIETINLILKITKSKNLELNLYFPIIIKHLLMPYELNICPNNHDILLFLSEFEILLELCINSFNNDDLELLNKYNHNFVKLILYYKTAIDINRTSINDKLILNTMISHFCTMFYFNQEKLENKYDIIISLTKNIIKNYQDFINYCYNEKIMDNFSQLYVELDKVQKEYIISYQMLEFYFNNFNKEEKRRSI